MSIKDDVLAYFEAHRGTDVSGQELARNLSVSRNAVWKAVEALRAEGYAIESGTNRGYRFSLDNDIPSAPGIRLSLEESLSDLDIIVFDEIDSTNNEAKRMLSSGFDGQALLVAKRQTAGRGRRNRRFESPAGGLYMTLVLQSESVAGKPTYVTMAAAVAVAHALGVLCNAQAGIKWVNDVFVGGKKVCGILTEGVSDLETGAMPNLVIGIGVNLGPCEFSEEVQQVATSVPLAGHHTRNEFAARIVRELAQSVSSAAEIERMMQEYRRLSIVLGREVHFETREGTMRAEAVDIDADGGLVVRTEDGNLTTLNGGEISVRF